MKVRDGGRDATLVQDDRLRWPDTFSEGPDGTIYVTSSRIQDMSWFKPENGPRLTTQLWRIEGRGRGGRETKVEPSPSRPYATPTGGDPAAAVALAMPMLSGHMERRPFGPVPREVR